MVLRGLFINVARRRTCMDQVGVKGAKHEEKWGSESVLKHETSSVNGGNILRCHRLQHQQVRSVCMHFAESAHVILNEHKHPRSSLHKVVFTVPAWKEAML